MQLVNVRRLVPAALGALALVSLVPAGVSGQVPEEARQLVRSGEPARAAELLRTAAGQRPGDADIMAALALALMDAGALDEALAIVSAAADAAPDHAGVARAHGLVLAARQEPRRAVEALDRALARHPRDAGLLAARGRVLWQLKRTDSAIEVLRQAAVTPALAAEAQYWLGRIYYFRGFEAEGAFPGWHEEVSFRPLALEAFRTAAAAEPAWYLPHVGVGETLLALGQAEAALQAFDTAFAKAPAATAATTGRWRTLLALGREQAVAGEVSSMAAAHDARSLETARQGYLLLKRGEDAAAVGERLLREHAGSPGAQDVLADRIAAAAAARETARVLEEGRAFVRQYPHSHRALDVYSALLSAHQTDRSTPLAEVIDTIETRARIRPEPTVYLAGAALLNARGEGLATAIELAEASVPASETFIRENISSYRMDGKVEGALARGRAMAVNHAGWAAFLQGNLDEAERRLVEAERLSSGQDAANQYYLGELARAAEDLERAHEHLLRALSLRGGGAQLQRSAHEALRDVHVRLGRDAAAFDGYLEGELERRREARRAEALRSMADQPLPPLTLDTVDGGRINLVDLRGKVLLLNFFASW